MGDYIKRDAFLADKRKQYCSDCTRRKNAYGKMVYDIGDAPCRACEIDDVLDALEDAPAADVRENVRGEWIHTDACPHKVYCSVCFNTYLRNEKWAAELPITLHPNFCPNCGADMKGEKDGNI